MKLCFFDDYKLGVVKADGVVDVSAVVKDIPHLGPHDLINGVIERFAQYRAKLDDAAAKGKAAPLGQVKLRAPLPRPTNIDCMAVNYMEDGTRSEPAPINAFHKSPSAVIGPDETMVLPDVPATIFEGEAEMAVVIGKRASQRARRRRDGLRLRLHELHRRLGARPAAGGQHVLSDEVARHVRADGPLHRHRRRDPGSPQAARSSSGSTASSSRTSTPTTWPTRSRAASSGSRASTRSSPATCSPPAPTTAG